MGDYISGVQEYTNTII